MALMMYTGILGALSAVIGTEAFQHGGHGGHGGQQGCRRRRAYMIHIMLRQPRLHIMSPVMSSAQIAPRHKKTPAKTVKAVGGV